jgi:hypothetical protein
MALRTAGLVAPPDERGAMLEKAVAALRTSRTELELARTLLGLGAHTRRTGREWFLQSLVCVRVSGLGCVIG